MKETGLTGKRRSTTIAATPDDGNSQRKRRRGGVMIRANIGTLEASAADATLTVVAGSLFHNITVLGKNGKACWSIL